MVTFFYIGLRPRILIADLDVIQDVLIKNISIFTNRPDVQRGVPSLLSLRDHQWKNIRQIVTPTFSSSKLKLMIPIMNDCTHVFIDQLFQKHPSDIEIYSMYQALTLDVISRCALALSLDCQSDPQHEFLLSVRRLFGLELSRIVVLLVCFPGLRYFFRLLFRFAPSQPLISFIFNNLRKVLEERRNIKKDHAVVDVLQLLVEASEGKHFKRNRSPKEELLNDEEILWNAYVFLLAGYETTSSALAYVTHCLSIHTDVQEKVWQEVQNAVGNKKDLTYEDVCQMKYMELVILESLRMYPPIPLFVSRECKYTTTIGNVTIPEGSVVEIPVWSLHHDPDLWPNPEVFDPYRHTAEEKAKRHSMAFLPFGAGPRNCIGGRFAMLEMKIVLTKFLQQFKILPSEHAKNPLPTIVRTFIMNPSQGLFIRATPRDETVQN